MRTKNLASIIVITLSICASCAVVPKRKDHSKEVVDVKPSVRTEILKSYTKDWPEAAAKAANEMIAKYGEPTESTPSMLMWKGIMPVKRILVYREEVIHQFPLPHKDVIEHVVAYKIPLNKAAELVKFDGSIIFDRTRGELSARSNEEAMNFLILNLASEIIEGKRSASNARKEYETLAVDYLNGNKSNLTQKLQFSTQANTAYIDQSTILNWAQAEEALSVKRLLPSEKKRLLKQAQEEEITE
jgi:hypothetical protein